MPDLETEHREIISGLSRWFWLVVNLTVGAVLVVFPLFWGGRSIGAEGVVSSLAFAGVTFFGVILLVNNGDFVGRLHINRSAKILGLLAFLFFLFPLGQVYLLKIPSADTDNVLPFLTWFVVVAIYFGFVLIAPVRNNVLRLWMPKQRRRVEERNLLYRACETDSVTEWFISAVILAAVISALVAILQWVTKGTLLQFFYFEETPSLIRQGRLHWPFINPNHLSTLLTIGAILSFLRLLRYLQISKLSMGPEPTLNARLRFIRSPERLGVHVLYFLVVAFLFLTNVLTLSRAGNIIMFVSLFTLYFVYSVLPVDVVVKRSKNRLSRWLGIVSKPTSFFLVCFVIIFIFLGDSDEQRVYERVAYGLAAGYDELRQLLLQSSWRMFADSWIFGVGCGCWSLMIPQYMTANMAGWDFDYAHNDLMQFFAETGIVGFSFVLVTLWLLIKNTLVIWKRELIPTERLQIVGLGLVILAPVVHSLVDFPFHLPALALIFGVVLAVYIRALKRFE